MVLTKEEKRNIGVRALYFLKKFEVTQQELEDVGTVFGITLEHKHFERLVGRPPQDYADVRGDTFIPLGFTGVDALVGLYGLTYLGQLGSHRLSFVIGTPTAHSISYLHAAAVAKYAEKSFPNKESLRKIAENDHIDFLRICRHADSKEIAHEYLYLRG